MQDPNTNQVLNLSLQWDYRKGNIVTISDLHVPYQHPDAIKFLEALKQRYNPKMVVCLGDMLDFHALSYHEADPDLLSAGDELRASEDSVRDIETIYPKMHVIDSNHGALPQRKAKSAGMPKKLLKTYREIYGLRGKGWTFVRDLTIETASKYLPDIHFTHGIKRDVLSTAAKRGQRIVSGHFHESFRIQYLANPNSLIWGVNAGCLVDHNSLAMAYGANNENKPIIGTCVIVRGVPVLEPMILRKNGRWTGKLL